jgi:hypothetical protein
MHRTSFHGPLLIAVLLAGCGDDGGGGDTASLIDRQIELDREQGMIECGCEPPGSCGVSTPTPVRVACFKSFAARYEAQIAPELSCEVRRLEAQNACFAGADCADTAAWEACYDAGGDCDDSFTESHEDEFRACVESSGPGTGGSTGTEPGSGGSTGTEPGSGGMQGSAGADDTPQTPPGSCQTHADCVVCDTAVVNGQVQCCMPCGMVTSADQCEENRALAGSCAAVSCPAVECTARPLATCVSGVCTASRGV